MYRKPTEKQLAKVPAFYTHENKGLKLADHVVYMHFFVGSCDWWMVEYSPEERVFFGYANLGNDMLAEWGYISLDELISAKKGPFEVDYDHHWKVRKVSEVKEIKKY